jgi:hypothetical protein
MPFQGPSRKRGTVRGLQAEFDPMADTVKAVELLLEGRTQEAARYFEAAELHSREAAERQTPRMSIWTGEPEDD